MSTVLFRVCGRFCNPNLLEGRILRMAHRQKLPQEYKNNKYGMEFGTPERVGGRVETEFKTSLSEGFAFNMAREDFRYLVPKLEGPSRGYPDGGTYPRGTQTRGT